MTDRKPTVARGRRATVGSIAVSKDLKPDPEAVAADEEGEAEEGEVFEEAAPVEAVPEEGSTESDPKPEEAEEDTSPAEPVEVTEEPAHSVSDDSEPVAGAAVRRGEGADGKQRDAGGNPVHPADLLAGDQDIVGDRSRSAVTPPAIDAVPHVR